MNLRYTRRDLDPAARAFYERLAGGEFTVARCAACGESSFPPREWCTRCGARDPALEVHAGAGTLHAFTTQERAFRFTAPDVLGLVDLDGVAGRALGVIRAPFEELAIGARMALAPVTVEEGWVLPAWEPGG